MTTKRNPDDWIAVKDGRAIAIADRVIKCVRWVKEQGLTGVTYKQVKDAKKEGIKGL